MLTERVRAPIERNIAMELVRVTEAAAISAARYMGFGDKELVDQAAVDAMRFTLGGVSMDGVVVIGEGEKDKAPMLYIGERIGDGSAPKGGHRRGPHRWHNPSFQGASRRHRCRGPIGAGNYELPQGACVYE